MTLTPYPEYQDSGVDWLGDIPSHWGVEKAKRIFQHKKELNRSGKNTNVLSLTLRGVVNNNPDDPEGLVPKDYATYQVFEKDNLVFKLIDLENLKTSRVGLVHENGIMSSAYVRLILQTLGNIRYFYHQFYDLYLRGVYNNLGAGVRSTLGQNDLLNLQILIPPPDEQAAIVTFLDAAETRIRRYIRAKQKLIKLLNEQKQAIIQQAVTRGLNPDAPMKDSGVEWLGEIPSHWEVRRVRTLVKRIEQGISPESSSYLADENSWGVLKSGCANRGVFRDTEHKRLPDGFPIESRIVLQVGDVIISRASGSPALVGSTARVHELNYRLILSDKTFRPIFQQTLLADFIVYSMNTRYYRIQVEQGISGAEGLANNLPVSELKDFRLVIPPIEEALEIVDYLNDELPVVEYLINEAQNSIDLIREYRTRLIADVVTGKVDVRGLAFEMPEDFDESDLLDVDEDDGHLDDSLFDDELEGDDDAED